ncbi:MAG TPA: EamA family transporter [Steroidobacteraceae bacterium]|nr:EamA family transporter [Steroidobacteraceae bacterium]
MRMRQPWTASLPAWRGAVPGLAAALLFGASTPLAKLLLGEGVAPQVLAGLLYLGSGVGLSALLAARWMARRDPGEAGLRPADLPQLAGAVALGGVLAPALLMQGLARTAAADASLLLNLEALATMGIAWIVYRENVDRRLLLGALAILAGAVSLSWQGTSLHATGGTWFIAGACLAWGADNNLTRGLARRDPLQIAAIKGLVAGIVNLALARLLHAGLPGAAQAGAAATVGFLGYGVSLVLFVLGLRHVGTARTAAYFSIAPFVGALLAVPLLSEPVTARLLVAGALMACGLWLHLAERHEHAHHHPALDHEHRHTHDEHHRHAHGTQDPPGEPHSHRHHHEPVTHRHAHYPDLHHRHDH